MKVKKQQTNHSEHRKPAIFLYDPDAIGVVVQRSRKERRSMSAALAVIVLEWAATKSVVRRSRAAASRTKSLPEQGQSTIADNGIQQEKLTDDGAAADSEKETKDGD